MSDRVQTCRCGRTFVQRKHERTGKPNPITTYEHPTGNVRINPDGTYGIVKKGEACDGPRHISHFVDCPEAGSFHRR